MNILDPSSIAPWMPQKSEGERLAALQEQLRLQREAQRRRLDEMDAEMERLAVRTSRPRQVEGPAQTGARQDALKRKLQQLSARHSQEVESLRQRHRASALELEQQIFAKEDQLQELKAQAARFEQQALSYRQQSQQIKSAATGAQDAGATSVQDLQPQHPS